MKKIFIAILAIAALVSCNQDNINDNTSVENTSAYPLLKVDNAMTKTVLDGTQVKFVVDDIISVFNGIVSEDNHHGHCLYQCISVENGVATFQWRNGIREDKDEPWNKYAPADDVDIVATFPNRSESTSAFEPSGDGYGAGTVMIRMVASGTASGDDPFVSTSLPIIACAPQGEMLKFKHTCGLLELTMKGTATIKKVEMASADVISGNASVEYASPEPVLTVVGTGEAAKDKKITYTYTDGVALTEAGTKLYFGLPVGTHDVTFTFTDTDEKTMVKTAKNLEIKRAVVTPTELTYVADVQTVKNLSANNSYANCYVVSEGGDYSFDAKKPDGVSVSGTAAHWVWAAGNSCTTAATLPADMMSNISYGDGKIYFSVPSSFVGGNVVLALIDSDKRIKYTWHVWLTSDPQDIVVAGMTVMDRNLGAICKYDVTTETVLSNMQYGRGNYYQWGRKDPILGSRNAGGWKELTTSGGNNQAYVINTGANIVNVAGWEIAETAGLTTEEAAAKPLVYVSSNTGVANYDPNDKSTPWCSRSNANPCPYGYRVMNDSEFSKLIERGITYAVCPSSSNMKQYTVGGVIFPVSGYRGTNSKQANIAEGWYFSDNVDPAAANKGSNCMFTGTTVPAATQASCDANLASLVRCVKVSE